MRVAFSLVKKTLENIEDRKLQRLLITLMTFLNPRQVAIVFYLYKELARQQSDSSVYFRSNELLEWLGYKRQKDGSLLTWLTMNLQVNISNPLSDIEMLNLNATGI